MPKAVEPSLGLNSYSCPHCRALAHQYWYEVFLKRHEKADNPGILDSRKTDRSKIGAGLEEDEKKNLLAFLDRLEKNVVTVQYLSRSKYCDVGMVNFSISRCHSCDGYAAWAFGKLVYPDHIVEFVPADDMPADVKADFLEAGSIFKQSPKGSAALLRLCVQKLMPHLDQKGKNLNADIGNLVTKGLDSTIQKALDVVRVIGNNAVHPGQIDLSDTPEIAAKLFTIVNVIVQSMITTPSQIHGLFESLPAGAKAEIEKRDSKN
jgi:hypothetical protein